MAKEAKTNAMRMLDRQKVKYEAFPYECDEFIDGLHSADLIGAPYEQSFKTLVMEGKSRRLLCVRSSDRERSRPQGSSQSSRRESSRHDPCQGYPQDYGICQGWLAVRSE